MSTDRQELEDQLEQARENLVRDVDALGEKFDVKSRAKAAASDERARRAAVVLAATAVGVVGLVLWRRSR